MLIGQARDSLPIELHRAQGTQHLPDQVLVVVMERHHAVPVDQDTVLADHRRDPFTLHRAAAVRVVDQATPLHAHQAEVEVAEPVHLEAALEAQDHLVAAHQEAAGETSK